MNTKKRALGRGLGALLQTSETDISAEYEGKLHSLVNTIPFISIDLIIANPYQPRNGFDENSLSELAESIKEHGIIQPVTVNKLDDEKFQLISGERRLRASIMAGLKAVPAYIKNVEKDSLLQIALVENIQREELNPMELALGFQRLSEEFNLTHDELSKKLSKNRTTITNYIRLLKLPAEIQVAIKANKISMGHARALINVDDEKTQLAIFNDIINKYLSVRKTEEIVRNISAKTKSSAKTIKFSIVDEYIKMKENLSKRLNTKIEIKMNKKGKGNIIIPFNTKQDFENIIKTLGK
ncbi:MAG: ParB/RepB/Spo0J family partition protein [Bacteroidales bacterium]|jgi:ParB family chromosome partitioning protein